MCASKIARLARLALKATSIIVPNIGIYPAAISMQIFMTCGWDGHNLGRFQSIDETKNFTNHSSCIVHTDSEYEGEENDVKPTDRGKQGPGKGDECGNDGFETDLRSQSEGSDENGAMGLVELR